MWVLTLKLWKVTKWFSFGKLELPITKTKAFVKSKAKILIYFNAKSQNHHKHHCNSLKVVLICPLKDPSMNRFMICMIPITTSSKSSQTSFLSFSSMISCDVYALIKFNIYPPMSSIITIILSSTFLSSTTSFSSSQSTKMPTSFLFLEPHEFLN